MADVQTAMDLMDIHNSYCQQCHMMSIYTLDARILPCKHLYCLPCIKNRMDSEEIICSVCSESHKTSERKSWAKVMGSVSATSRCCSCCEKAAEVYCEDCDRYLCREDLKIHDKMNEHVILGRRIYESLRLIDHVEKCKAHRANNSLVCMRCRLDFCQSCDLDGICDTELGLCHLPTKLEDLDYSIRVKLHDQSQVVEDKMDTIKKYMSEASQQLQRCEEKVVFLRPATRAFAIAKSWKDKRSPDVNRKLTEYHSAMSCYVREYTRNLENLADVFLNHLDAIEHLLHLPLHAQYNIISLEKNLTKQFQEIKAITIPSYVCRAQSIYHNADTVLEDETRLPFVWLTKPTTFNYETDKRETCLFVRWTRDGQLITCSNSVISVRYGLTLEPLQAVDLGQTCLECVAETSKGFIATVYDRSLKKTFVRVYSRELCMLGRQSEVMDLKEVGHEMSKMDTLRGTSQAVLLNSVSGSLNLFTSTKSMLDYRRLPESHHASGIHALRSDEFLVTDVNKDVSVRKFVFMHPSLCLMLAWCYSGISNANDVTSDEVGYIYVSSSTDNAVTILSADGMLVGKIKLPIVRTQIVSIAVYKDLLAVACGFGGIYLYKIGREATPSLIQV